MSVVRWLIQILNKIDATYDTVVQIEKDVKIIKSDVAFIKKALGAGVPVKLVLKFTIQGVNLMPVQITDKQAVVITPSETDAVGNPVTLDPTQISYAVSDTSALTLVTNPTASPVAAPDGQQIPAGGAWIQAAQQAGHLGSFQVTSHDAANNLDAQDTVTVVNSAGTSLTMNFGTPQ